MAKAKRKRGKLTGAAKRAFLRRMAAGRRRSGAKRNPSPRRRRRSTSHSTPIMAKRKRRRLSARRNPPRSKRRRRARRNPPASLRGIVGMAVGGVKDAALITVGRGVTHTIARKLPFANKLPDVAVQTAVALATGVAARLMVGGDMARIAFAGALSVPMDTALRKANVPLLTAALASDEEISARYYSTIGAYPHRGRIGAYPHRRAIGDGMPTTTALATTSQGNGFF